MPKPPPTSGVTMRKLLLVGSEKMHRAEHICFMHPAPLRVGVQGPAPACSESNSRPAQARASIELTMMRLLTTVSRVTCAARANSAWVGSLAVADLPVEHAVVAGGLVPDQRRGVGSRAAPRSVIGRAACRSRPGSPVRRRRARPVARCLRRRRPPASPTWRTLPVGQHRMRRLAPACCRRGWSGSTRPSAGRPTPSAVQVGMTCRRHATPGQRRGRPPCRSRARSAPPRTGCAARCRAMRPGRRKVVRVASPGPAAGEDPRRGARSGRGRTWLHGGFSALADDPRSTVV